MKTLLIIEDHPVIADELASAFINLFYSVTVAGSVSEAAKIIANTKLDAIIVDCNLPDGRGFDLLTQAKPFTSIIGISADGLNADHAYKSKCHVFIKKPFSTEEIIAAVNRHTMHSPAFNELTSRELEILGLIKNGLSSSEISTLLNISIETVSTHRKSIKHKFGGLSFMDICQLSIGS